MANDAATPMGSIAYGRGLRNATSWSMSYRQSDVPHRVDGTLHVWSTGLCSHQLPYVNTRATHGKTALIPVLTSVILSRILYYIPYLAPLHPGRVATTFVGLDGVCEILIGNGAWRLANSSMTDTQRKVGSRMVIASLCLQTALFGAFGILSAQFHRRAKSAGVLKRDLEVLLYVMYVSAIIVTTRCIYRLVEYIEGWQSSVYQNEVYFWIFEATIMFINTALLNIFHPGKRLPKSNSVFLARDGVTERKGLGWADDRPWIITVFDPFDLWGLVRGEDKKTQFWDMTDHQLEQARLKKKERKRSVLAGLLDPFHLWGKTGYIGQHLELKRPNSGQHTPAREAIDTDAAAHVDGTSKV
jgi:hypothetical protein